MTASTGKRNRRPSRTSAQVEGDERRAQAERLAQARARRERLIEQQRSNESAELVLLARKERAKRIAAGKLVAPTIDEYREGRGAKYTSIGDLT
jgi:hypothetical protein